MKLIGVEVVFVSATLSSQQCIPDELLQVLSSFMNPVSIILNLLSVSRHLSGLYKQTHTHYKIIMNKCWITEHIDFCLTKEGKRRRSYSRCKRMTEDDGKTHIQYTHLINIIACVYSSVCLSSVFPVYMWTHMPPHTHRDEEIIDIKRKHKDTH